MEIVELETATSTNNELKKLAERGAKNFTVVTAKTQTKGRGRYDRQWESSVGNLFLSVLIENPKPALSLIAGIAAAETIKKFGLEPKLKWPNDVLVNGKKIAGILVEAETGIRNYAIIGIGINITNAPDYGCFIGGQATAAEVRGIFLKQLETSYSQGFAQKEWMKYAGLVGEQIQVKSDKSIISGIFKGITEAGEMILENSGKTEIIAASEICS